MAAQFCSYQSAALELVKAKQRKDSRFQLFMQVRRGLASTPSPPRQSQRAPLGPQPPPRGGPGTLQLPSPCTPCSNTDRHRPRDTPARGKDAGSASGGSGSPAGPVRLGGSAAVRRPLPGALVSPAPLPVVPCVFEEEAASGTRACRGFAPPALTAAASPLCPGVQEAESHPQCRRLQLRDLIISEMQRLTKYPLLLQSIGQNTGAPAGPAPPATRHASPTSARDWWRPGLGFTGRSLPCPQKSPQNGRKWSWRLSAAGKSCTMSTKRCGTWRTCW